MIEELLPPGAIAVETRTDPPDAVLFPEEQAELALAVEKRRLEFTTVRHCARSALARLGVAPVAILPGLRGAPQWPAGIVGSMTHCAGYRAAVVARSEELATIGVDAEPHEALPPEVLTTVTIPEERERLERLAAQQPAVHWDRLLFSAKESVYKAWFPLTGRWLDFEEASVDFRAPDHESGSFYARLLVPGPVVAGVTLLGFTGHWLVRDGLLFTAIAVAPNGSSAERTIVL
ncbi:4'-phosphopantetheinyl transferase family protein [Actinocrinis sp.]|uniref:4'-phosphopantetheinyl transferase family protein n=1 Tax=Actinocrinis sp. TaxID=1920516 RepID=UPI002D0BAB21|nr:4'-phosphopantetheinyl transferase superfamily protein [Actinocrinis sp.]HXR71402.1 4'-phosphopantetheinyl transferase superfamily protein [Actinocrinis sp.]